MAEQLSLFDLWYEPIHIDKKIRLIELFAGYGSQAMALKRIGADFEHYRVVEFDKYAVASYNAVHGTDFPPMDITKVHAEDLNICDTDKYEYILTYSFPCQDLSVAGRQRGMDKGSGTRSGLLWEVERILKECIEYNGNIPSVLMMENVPQVHAEKNMNNFQKWLSLLESLGYKNYWQDLNAKDYGIPQNRLRCFCFSFLGDYNYHFPEPIPLKLRLKDILEDEVDEKYYLKSEKAQKLIDTLIENGTLEPIPTSGGGREQPLTEQSRIRGKSTQQTVSLQNMTAEYQTEQNTVCAYVNRVKVDEINVNVAKTICARDYKGFGTGFNTMNGVIECKMK